jgi:hypothetical protein
LDQWRQRLGGRRRRTQPQSLAATGYLINGPVLDSLIEVENLTIVILWDEEIRPGHCALRLAGYAGNRVPWGVRFGGTDNCQFYKDLLLQPVAGARGYRLDLANPELLELGLQLDRELERHARFRRRHVHPHLRLPKLWAAFRPTDAAAITGDGPELAVYAARTGKSPERLLERLRRDHHGLICYPLAWVSHHWEQAVAIFADLERFPRRQAFSVRRRPDDLVGYQDAAEFHFQGGFHAGVQRRSRRRRKPALAPA